MALPLLAGSDDAESIRYLVSPETTAEELSDARIFSPIFYGAVQAELVRRIEDVATVVDGSPERDAYRTVAMYWTAAAILGTQPVLTSEKFTDEYSYSQDAGAITSRIAWLRSQGEDALTPYLGDGALGGVFARVPGGRGRI